MSVETRRRNKGQAAAIIITAQHCPPNTPQSHVSFSLSPPFFIDMPAFFFSQPHLYIKLSCPIPISYCSQIPFALSHPKNVPNKEPIKDNEQKTKRSEPKASSSACLTLSPLLYTFIHHHHHTRPKTRWPHRHKTTVEKGEEKRKGRV